MPCAAQNTKHGLGAALHSLTYGSVCSCGLVLKLVLKFIVGRLNDEQSAEAAPAQLTHEAHASEDTLLVVRVRVNVRVRGGMWRCGLGVE